ncbi:MAG: hypothetical protein KAV87_18990 [Desulfobacteraceae bacterium]|nr:hypothetical protein [Desulfobacteraceae bacterium]
MDALARAPIQMPFDDIKVTIPHPADFALHKLLIAGRRKQKAKAEKDRIQAVALLMALKNRDEIETVRSVYHAMPRSWRKIIKRELLDLGEEEVLDLANQT